MDFNQKTVWILIGPNGAGKSTFVSAPPEDMLGLQYLPYLNPDPLLKRNLQLYGQEDYLDAFKQTSEDMNAFVQSHLIADQSFIVEKVMPTLGFVGATFTGLQAQGWKIATIAIGLDNPDISKSRVAHRVKKGGHDVKVWDLASAFSMHVELLPNLIEISDYARVYDNSNFGYKLVGEKRGKEAPLCSTSPYNHSAYMDMIMALSVTADI